MALVIAVLAAAVGLNAGFAAGAITIAAGAGLSSSFSPSS
jgi:hypothetical protein